MNSSDCRPDLATRPNGGKLCKPYHLEEGEVVTRFHFSLSDSSDSFTEMEAFAARKGVW